MPARVHIAAIIVRLVVVVAAQDDLDEGHTSCEAHWALGGHVGALREVELHLCSFLVGSYLSPEPQAQIFGSIWSGLVLAW